MFDVSFDGVICEVWWSSGLKVVFECEMSWMREDGRMVKSTYISTQVHEWVMGLHLYDVVRWWHLHVMT